MDVNSLGNVSSEFRDMFANLLHHVCSIDVRTKGLVLDLMEAIAQTDTSIVDGDDGNAGATCDNVGIFFWFFTFFLFRIVLICLC